MRSAVGLAIAASLLVAAPASAQEPAAPPAAARPDLVRETLPADIQSAGTYELAAWCRSLGLSDTGTRAELQARLYAHFDVAAAPEPTKPARVIIVENARSTDYFTIEGIEEDYLILEGDVRVEFRDSEAGVSHRVAAERLIVNQTRRTLSASGGVTYELVRSSGSPEVFRGESFNFDLAGWGGLILDGSGKSERQLEEGKPAITFYYRGSSIIRRENETVILHDGSVTSSVAEEPYWQIAASRMRVLGPGEWAISNAVLQLGRVPLFYLPFFYKPGDQMLFHPSLGFRSREGSFIQTTTYLIGEAEQKPGTLSFLQLTGDQEGYDTEVQGIFLRKVKSEGQAQQPAGAPAAAPAAAPKDVLKIMIDYYSRLGGFAGLLLVLDPVWTLKGGIGFTRTVFYDGQTGAYTPFDPVAGSSASDWNVSHLAGIELPFRYGFDGSVNLTGQRGALQSTLALFSDPYVSSDLFNRAEKIDWTGLLAGPEAAAAEVKAGGLDPTERQNLLWTATGRYRIAPAPPWLESLEVSKVDLALYWQSQQNLSAGDYDPARRFFEPTRLMAPDLRLRLAGNLFKTAAAAATQAAAPPPPGGDEARIAQPQDPEEPRVEAPEIRVPGPLPDLAGLDAAWSPASLEVSYALQPRLKFESPYVTGRTAPEAVDFRFLYSLLEVSGTNRLQALLKMWDERLEARAAIVADGVHVAHFNRSSSYTGDWDGLLIRDYLASRLDVGPALDLSLLPLAGRRSLARTRLAYALAWDTLSLDYDGPLSGPLASGYEPAYRSRLFDWRIDTVTRHELSGRLAYQPGLIADFLDLKADLPPRTGYYRGESDFTLGFARTNVKGGYKETAESWTYDPLVITETLDPAAWIQAVGRLEVDLNDRELDRSDNTVRLVRLPPAVGTWLFEQRVVLQTRLQPVTLWQSTVSAFGLTARFLAERRIPVEWGGTSFVATGEGPRLLPAEALLSYKAPTQPMLLWRNRIRLVPLVTANLLFDLYRFTNSRLETTAGVKATIHRFLDVDLSVSSYNRQIFQYVAPWGEEVEIVPGTYEWVNPLEDLWWSFSFWDRDKRKASFFKLGAINVKANHDLGDWNIAFEYSGAWKLEPKSGGVGDDYVWLPTFSIVIEWKPIPEIRRSVQKDTGGELSVRG